MRPLIWSAVALPVMRDLLVVHAVLAARPVAHGHAVLACRHHLAVSLVLAVLKTYVLALLCRRPAHISAHPARGLHAVLVGDLLLLKARPWRSACGLHEQQYRPLAE